MVALRAVTFHSDGATFEYAVPDTDVRDNGLVQNHVLFVPATSQFADKILDLMAAASSALEGFLQDYTVAEPAPLEDGDEDDVDGPAPFDNPNDFT